MCNYKKIIYLFFNLLVISSAFGNGIKISKPLFFIDSTRNLTLEEYLTLTDIEIFDGDEYFTKYNYNSHWVEHKIKVNHTDNYRISIKFQTINVLALYILDEHNKLINTYKSSNLDLKIFENTASGYFETFCKLQSKQSYRLIIKARNEISTFKLPIEITSASKVAESNYKFYMKWLFVFGIIFILSIVSLMVYIIMKNKIFMYYGLFIFSYGTWIASYHGLIPVNFAHFFTGFFHYDQFIFFGFFFVIFYFNFSLEYLKEASFNTTKIIRKWVNIYLSVQFVICCFYFPSNDALKHFMVLSYNLIMVAIILYLICILARGLWLKQIMSFFYFIAVLPMFCLFGYHRLAKLFQFNYHNSLDKYFLFAMLFEAIWMILGIIYQLKKINEHTRKLEIENLKYQEEKLHLSREIHDSIGSQFTLIKKSLEEIEKETPAKDKVLNLHNFVARSIRDLQNSIWTLNKEKTIQLIEVNLRLLDTIAFLKNTQDEIKISYLTEGNFEIAVDSLFCINLFRVINEFVNNSLKHSKCSEIMIKINSLSSELIIELSDNGIGFDKEKNQQGNGIKNMMHRMDKNGAQIDLSSDQNGTRLKIRKQVK